MAISQKNHFKLRDYLKFRLGRRVNLILDFAKFKKLFRKI